MRISEIKGVLGKGKLKAIVSSLWDVWEYRHILEALPPETSTSIDICEAVIDGFLGRLKSLPEADAKAIRMIRREKDDIQSLCKNAFGDKNYWSRNTEWEDIGMLNTILELSVRAEKALQMDALWSIRERLKLKLGVSDGAIKRILRDDELSEEIKRKESEIHSREDLYTVCESIIISRMREGKYKNADFLIMKAISDIARNDPFVWIAEHNLSSDYFIMRGWMQRTTEDEYKGR